MNSDPVKGTVKRISGTLRLKNRKAIGPLEPRKKAIEKPGGDMSPQTTSDPGEAVETGEAVKAFAK